MGAANSLRTYTNPLGKDLFMGDPFVVRYDDRYYLTGTTDSGTGFRIWSSPNLVDWEPLGFAYRAGKGSWGQNYFWAPELFRLGGSYYLAYSAAPAEGKGEGPGFRLCLAASSKPEGPYEDIYAPWCDFGYSAIDAHVFIDSDGSAYLYYARVGVIREPKFKLTAEIYGLRLKQDLSGPETEPVLVIKPEQDWETPDQGRSLCNEGPFVFREGSRYYLTYSANHFEEPFYGIGYATSPAPLGPWTKASENPMLRQNIELGLSGPGHCSVTGSPDGRERFIVYHAHADPKKPLGIRMVNIDRLIVDENNRLKVLGPTRTPQPMPSGAY